MALALVLTACSGGGQQAQADPFENIKRIQTAKVLKVGTGAGYYPFEMLDKSGKIVGFDMDIAQAMADALGVELEVVDFKDFDAILPALGAGKVDMVLSGMTIVPTRNLKVAFVGPYFASGKSILTKKVNVESVDEIAKMNNPEKVLVALKGSTSQMFVEKICQKPSSYWRMIMVRLWQWCERRGTDH